MDRAFQTMKLPLGAYQYIDLLANNLGDQFTNSGKEPRTVSAVIESPGPGFKKQVIALHLTEQAQRHLIAALQANLDDDKRRACELITVFHPEYGRYEP